MGQVSGPPPERWYRGNGGLAPLRPVPLPHLVGLGDDAGPGGARNPLPACPGYHDRDGRGLAAGARVGRRGGKDTTPAGGGRMAAPPVGGGPAPAWGRGPRIAVGPIRRTDDRTSG